MLRKICLATLLLFGASIAMAHEDAKSATVAGEGKEVASDVVQIKTPSVTVFQTDLHKGAAFMELDNNGSMAHNLIAAYSPVAKQVQIHRTVQKNGMHTMRQIHNIRIAAKHEQNLQPGGFHVMLIGMQKDLKVGDQVPITLLFADGSYLNLTARVTEHE